MRKKVKALLFISIAFISSASAMEQRDLNSPLPYSKSGRIMPLSTLPKVGSVTSEGNSIHRYISNSYNNGSNHTISDFLKQFSNEGSRLGEVYCLLKDNSTWKSVQLTSDTKGGRSYDISKETPENKEILEKCVHKIVQENQKYALVSHETPLDSASNILEKHHSAVKDTTKFKKILQIETDGGIVSDFYLILMGGSGSPSGKNTPDQIQHLTMGLNGIDFRELKRKQEQQAAEDSLRKTEELKREAEERRVREIIERAKKEEARKEAERLAEEKRQAERARELVEREKKEELERVTSQNMYWPRGVSRSLANPGSTDPTEKGVYLYSLLMEIRNNAQSIDGPFLAMQSSWLSIKTIGNAKRLPIYCLIKSPEGKWEKQKLIDHQDVRIITDSQRKCLDILTKENRIYELVPNNEFTDVSQQFYAFELKPEAGSKKEGFFLVTGNVSVPSHLSESTRSIDQLVDQLNLSENNPQQIAMEQEARKQEQILKEQNARKVFEEQAARKQEEVARNDIAQKKLQEFRDEQDRQMRLRRLQAEQEKKNAESKK